LTVTSTDTTDELKGFAVSKALLHVVPHALAVIGMDEVAVIQWCTHHEVFGSISCQFPTSLADEAHRPVGVVLTTIDHPGKITE
jgi:hypothetical protein